ncbi:MAG: hypothetical protein LBM13_00850 [Candidatus Ancillula sp.]|jgi:hypothetical protein|nr:hypothetical protein [Candidatus Ancillula sp.]
MNKNVAGFVIFVIEKVAAKFFGGNKRSAYCSMRDAGTLARLAKDYDVEHSLGLDIILEGVKADLDSKEMM